MKTKCYGSVPLYMHRRPHSSLMRIGFQFSPNDAKDLDLYCKEAFLSYRTERENGTEIDSPNWVFRKPKDDDFDIMIDATALYRVRYNESGVIKTWMEEKDFNYLNRIRVENFALFEREFAELKAANSMHSAIPKLSILLPA